jgi:hypothetical protein
MSTYARRLKAYLAGYKRDILGIVEDGLWLQNNQPYAHLLPADKREQNVLEPIREQFWRYADTNALRTKLHRDFHHLTSSQAFAFNVFFPFFGMPWSQPEILLRGLGLPRRELADCKFEAIPDPDEETNFDFLSTSTDGTRLLVEVKLSESEFGRCEDDETHRNKLDTIYGERLRGKVQASALEKKLFFEHYQLLRNVSHLAAGDVLVFLLPRANSTTFKRAQKFVEEIVLESVRPAVRLVAVEDFIRDARSAGPNSETLSVLQLLERKYVLASAT